MLGMTGKRMDNGKKRRFAEYRYFGKQIFNRKTPLLPCPTSEPVIQNGADAGGEMKNRVPP